MMFNNFEKISRYIYRQFRKDSEVVCNDHPDEEALSCFLEQRLSQEEKSVIENHLMHCASCAEYISVGLKLEPDLDHDLSPLLLGKIEKLIGIAAQLNILEIFIKLKDQALEILQTTGDLLVGQELVPAPILRSRKINEFKEEIIILEDLEQVRVLAKIQNSGTKNFNLTITVKDKQNQEIHENLRITLVNNGTELESRVCELGNCFFECILPGNYTVEIIQEEKKVALINLKVQI